MRRSRRQIAILAVASVFVMTPLALRAGAEKESIVLRVAPGARSLGMGVTGVADTGDVANAFHNPAVVSLRDGIALSGGHDNYNGDRNQFDFALATSGAVRESGLRIGGGLFHSRVETRVRVGGSAFKVATHESFMSAAFAAAWDAPGAFRMAGGTAVRWSTSSGFETDVLFDVGALVSKTLVDGRRFLVGASAGISERNAGGGSVQIADTSGTTRAEIDGRLAWGVALDTAWKSGERTLLRLALGADVFGGIEDPAIGGELTFFETLSLRGGYRDAFFDGKSAATAGAGFGRRIDFFTFRFDYAFVEAHDGSWHTNALGTTIAFEW